MKTRNASYNASGVVDCEIEHPLYGWIPFTAMNDDPEPLGRAIYADAKAGKLGKVAKYSPPPVAPYSDRLALARGSARLTRREFFLALDAAGIYDTIMAAELPRAAKIELDTATMFERNWPTLVEMAHSLGFADTDLDALFGIEVA
jgi:hypothetical protein